MTTVKVVANLQRGMRKNRNRYGERTFRHECPHRKRVIYQTHMICKWCMKEMLQKVYEEVGKEARHVSFGIKTLDRKGGDETMTKKEEKKLDKLGYLLDEAHDLLDTGREEAVCDADEVEGENYEVALPKKALKKVATKLAAATVACNQLLD